MTKWVPWSKKRKTDKSLLIASGSVGLIFYPKKVEKISADDRCCLGHVLHLSVLSALPVHYIILL